LQEDLKILNSLVLEHR